MTLKNIANTLKNFCHSTEGSMIPLFAVCIPVVIGTAGLALEYSKISNERTKLESALDSTVLNIGSKLFKKSNNGKNFQEQFEKIMVDNLTGRGLGHDFKIEEFDANKGTGQLMAKVSAELDTSFMSMFGYNTVKVEAESAAIFKQPKTEITMMLDTTGSMGKNGKMNALKKAAKDAIDIFLKDQDANVRVGLVPYSATVNVGKENAEIVTKNNTDVASISGFEQPGNNVQADRCVSERSGRDRATDASYKQSPIGSHEIAVKYADCPTAEILPLTTSKTALKERINSMTTEGGTAGHLGIAWSYYMLSDKWNTLWAENSEPAAYGQAKKIAIIMTDGEFNQAYENLAGDTNIERSERLALELCEDMKASKDSKEGITVYSVAFSAPASAQTLLKKCANEDTDVTTYYYSADNEKELRSAFHSIAKSITKLRLSR